MKVEVVCHCGCLAEIEKRPPSWPRYERPFASLACYHRFRAEDTKNRALRPCKKCGSVDRSPKSNRCLRCVKDWSRNNKERIAKLNHEWAMRNKQRRLAYDRARHLADPTYRPERCREWAQANKEHRSHYHHMRNAKIRGGSGRHSKAEWRDLLSSYGGLCIYCHKRAVARDHVTPIARGGSNNIDNIAPSCIACNSSKRGLPLMVWLAWRAGVSA